MSSTTSTPPTEARRGESRAALVRLLFGFSPAQVLQVAAQLGVVDHLGTEPRATAELADATGTHERSLGRLLRALACFGVVEQPAPGTWVLGPHGEPLRADAPDSIRNLARLFCGDEVWRSWGLLEQAVRTGQSTWEQVTGLPPFAFMEANPDYAAMFNEAMAESTRAAVPGIVAVGGFDRFRRLLDVGGGDGTLMAGLLAATPGLRGVVLDTKAGTAATHRTLDTAGVADRCEVVVGDFFAGVPAGADAQVVKSIVHDWDDEDAVRILAACRAALPDDGVLLVVEPVLPPTASAAPDQAIAVMSDLNMLVCTGGRERTEVELRTLLDAAGFTLRSVTPCPGPTNYCVLEAVPAR